MVKETMLVKDPTTSHNSLKIVVRKTLLNAFLTSTYIMAQSGSKSKRAWMPKGMASQPLRVHTLN
jgi:hypothetical protein